MQSKKPSVPKVSDPLYLKKQYRDASRFSSRVNLHLQFSTSPRPWFLWVFDHFRHLPADSHILEMGSGTGFLWKENIYRLPRKWRITLSDQSAGMLKETQKNLNFANSRQFTFATIDAQSIPFKDEVFDAVAANHMLYHVPNRSQAFFEIKRVIKPGGRLFAATNGAGHMKELWLLMFEDEPKIDFGQYQEFSLENGKDQLKPWFNQIRLHKYDNNLAVTAAEPLIRYAFSSRAGSILNSQQKKLFIKRVEEKLLKEKVIRIQKNTGLFEAWNEKPS